MNVQIERVGKVKEVRCSFYEFSKPIRFCSNLVETFFNPFPIRKCKKNWGSPCWFSRWRWSKFPWLHTHFHSGFFYLLCWLEGNELLSVLKYLGKHYHWARNDFESFFALAIVLQVKIANTILGCLVHNGHTWANLGQMYLYDFYKIFTKCLYGYIIWKNAKKTGGHHVG